jgi:hypothetical protein
MTFDLLPVCLAVLWRQMEETWVETTKDPAQEQPPPQKLHLASLQPPTGDGSQLQPEER